MNTSHLIVPQLRSDTRAAVILPVHRDPHTRIGNSSGLFTAASVYYAPSRLPAGAHTPEFPLPQRPPTRVAGKIVFMPSSMNIKMPAT
jgi:hypothetical protein